MYRIKTNYLNLARTMLQKCAKLSSTSVLSDDTSDSYLSKFGFVEYMLSMYVSRSALKYVQLNK
jgi:hypothetical protein